MGTPATALPAAPIAPQDGWCDDPADPAYNRPVPLPYPARHERLWREDEIYDLLIVLGHNDDPRFRFKALVSHAGVYNLESMAGATEELWFVNWEFKGMPWENRVNYDRWSPHRFAAKFSTPTLVTAGELDYRVPVDQSLQLYTALQLKKVPSKLIVFPDEGHWILKPQNSEFWYRSVLDWLAKHL